MNISVFGDGEAPELVQASVSVVIPAWNRADTVSHAICSALGQSVPVLEVLVCDDGSTDDSYLVVDQIARQDARVRWLPGERAGRPAIPRNRGLRASKGDWIAFLDSDDAWLPDKLKLQFEMVRKACGLAACSNAMRFSLNGSEAGELLDWREPRVTLSDLLSTNRVVCSSCIVHRSVLDRTGGFPEGPEFRAIEDYALWLRVAALTDFAYCQGTLVRYRDDPEGSIRANQSIPPDAQKALVLEATGNWVRNSSLGTVRAFSALTQIRIAQARYAVAAMARRLRHGAAR